MGIFYNISIDFASNMTVKDRKEAANLHAFGVELMPAGQAHDSADTVDVFFQAHDTLPLSSHVSPTPFRKAGLAFLLGGVDTGIVRATEAVPGRGNLARCSRSWSGASLRHGPGARL